MGCEISAFEGLELYDGKLSRTVLKGRRAVRLLATRYFRGDMVSKYPEHDKDCFYKFTSMETASLILENGTFRYSPPSEFNDPFDIQTELYFDFDIGDLPDAVTNEVHRIVTGARKVILNPASDWGKALGLLIEKHGEGKYKKEQLDFLVKPLIGYLSSIFEETRVLYNKHWGNLLNTIKVFCVSENNTSVLMWSHYAEYHTGVCFKLKELSEKDNPLCVAREVQYLPFPPSFFNAGSLQYLGI